MSWGKGECNVVNNGDQYVKLKMLMIHCTEQCTFT
jgi:hypothetical protein